MSDFVMLFTDPKEAFQQGYDQAKAQDADTIAALTARVKELEGVLTPFAKALKGNWSHQPDLTMVGAGINSSDLRMNLTLGDFRRARAAITQETRDE